MAEAPFKDGIDPRDLISEGSMHARQVLAIAIATALNALDGFDVLSIAFASPGISAEWHVSRAALGIVLSMELIGMAMGAFCLGAFADRRGRRPAILTCLVIMAAGMTAAALSSNVIILSAVRLFTGLGIGGMLAATNAVVAECASARRRNLAVSIMAGGYPLGAIIGGLLAANLIAATGRWQSVFLLGATATAVFIPLVLWLVPETIAFLCYRQPPDAMARLNRSLARLGRAPLVSLPPLRAAARIRIAHVLTPALFSITVLLVCAYFFHMMNFYFLMKWIPKIVSDRGFSPAAAGGVLIWANVGGVTGALTTSLLSQRMNIRTVVVGAMACGGFAVAAFGQPWGHLATLSLAAAIAGFFTNGATAGLYATFAQAFPAHLRAGGTGLVIGIGRGGAALGPILAGLLLGAGWALPIVAAILGCGGLLGGAALLVLGRRGSAVTTKGASIVVTQDQ